MRLKKIKLAGFKSFVDATSIPFPGDMTAVVGPNGCGKSNVIDAVRWVLGESSAKNLRGDSMTDVIFNGSSARKAVSQCSVELVFDNASGRIGGEYANYAELSVKRIVTKDATSSYMLNGAKCRRRDVTDLFLGTGLGPRSYAIIEQGMISKLIESKPQELRVFIEEAAGISKYKERRRETENRIKHTKENLERLDDVRAELGQQLSKLQRQASAAKRFTELKADERRLKAQLAAVRWLKQSEQQADSHDKISNLQVNLEEVLSQQTQDESSLIILREEQATLKQGIDDIQQNLFKIGTDITKIEQSQLFTAKRKAQIQTEMAQLQSAYQGAQLELETLNEQLLEVQEQVVIFEPQKLELEEALEQAQIDKQVSDEALFDFNRDNREAEQTVMRTQQAIQRCHSQIQATMELQSRTESQIADLRRSLEQSELAQAKEDLSYYHEQQEEMALQVEECQIKKDDVLENLHQAKSSLDEKRSQLDTTNQEYLSLKAEITGLTSLQTNEADNQTSDTLADIDTVPLWQYLQVKKGSEALFEKVLAYFPNAQVILNKTISELNSEIWQSKSASSFWFEGSFSAEKQDGSLAMLLDNTGVPNEFNRVFIVDNELTAVSRLRELPADASVITLEGKWLFNDRFFTGNSAGNGNIQRAARINQLKESIEIVHVRLLEAEELVSTANDHFIATQSAVNEVESQLNGLKQSLFEHKLRADNASQKVKEFAANEEKYRADIERLDMTLALEEEKLEELNEQTSELSIQLLEAEGQVEGNEQLKTSLESDVQKHSQRINELNQQRHQVELATQQVKNQYLLLNEKKTQYSNQLEETNEKLLLLREEAEELEMPIEDQAERLQALLEQKQIGKAKQDELNNRLAEIQESLLLVEKGQAGINQKADKIKAEIESERLIAEGCRVRAQGFLSQLSDMQQAIKPILDDLPDDIDEEVWQADLDKAQANIARLGAVNLAAVDEFEQQSERKQHLDTQNEDLCQALDTLESAIRKIDKETRSRFKATYDQVNNDLKMLFPKVFGGGSAYLDLTDDDLLDTGVTIMARPPGKKNSTIHLLSGGEKALTALSLVFAIFRLNPAPFCLLDEVDAPLDDANVGRFCKLVSEMSKTVQFIYITHNKVAMEMATHLTGVTMAEPGVSRMVAVDVEEALAIAE
ncbi:chromosome segregation protein SMC [Glaciecola sp. KUL10]|uniref:chromosome segregation protein SMC n=1 Tax=Glaciecola sp. (strain KUL10) TaxID=2161813 RepID=UPI000D78B8EF|nr:chromosome segregation protein SMC [Glaciecola sp. KUL10]